MAAPGPADPDNGNIFCQFDVQGKRELVAGSAPVVGRFFCLLPPCHQELYIATSRLALASHRELVHGLPNKGRTKLPTLRDIKDWILIGTPRPYEVPEKPELGSRTGKAASLRRSLVPGGEAGMAKLQPASLGSNIFEQFDVRQKEGFPNPTYICLLAPCFENEVCFESHASWETHRSKEHMESNDDKNKLPAEWEIRDWVAKNKPRPSDVEPVHSLIDPGVFAELDIRVTDEGKERYFCLLDPCSRSGKSFLFYTGWSNHRERHHNYSSCEDGVFTIPTAQILKAWVENGKPVPFRIPPQLLPAYVQVYSGARHPTKSRLEERRLVSKESTDRNVFFEIDFSRDVDGKSWFFCLLPNCVSSGMGFERRETLETHRSIVHTDLPQLEPLPLRHVIDRWFWLGKPRPYTPNKRGRPRTRDAAGGSTEREPAPQKNLRSGGCSVAAVEEHSNHAARGGDLSGSFRRDFNDDLMTSPDDEIASNECSDPDYEDRAQNDVDDNNVDQTWGDPANQYSAGMAEVGEGAPGELVAAENMVPQLSSVQSEMNEFFEDDDEYQVGDLWKPVSLSEIFRADDYDLSDLPRAEDTPGMFD